MKPRPDHRSQPQIGTPTSNRRQTLRYCIKQVAAPRKMTHSFSALFTKVGLQQQGTNHVSPPSLCGIVEHNVRGEHIPFLQSVTHRREFNTHDLSLFLLGGVLQHGNEAINPETERDRSGRQFDATLVSHLSHVVRSPCDGPVRLDNSEYAKCPISRMPFPEKVRTCA
jgi:hypothetical protein